MVTTTKKINLAQLDAELKAGGLNMESLNGEHTIVPISNEITKAKLQKAVDDHVAIDDPRPTIAEKLASVGLNIHDLKAALGV